MDLAPGRRLRVGRAGQLARRRSVVQTMVRPLPSVWAAGAPAALVFCRRRIGDIPGGPALSTRFSIRRAPATTLAAQPPGPALYFQWAWRASSVVSIP